MATLTRQRPMAAALENPDPSWRSLYLTGGICALLASLAYIVAMIVEFSTESAPTSGGAATLTYIADHRAIYILQQILWTGPSILLMVTFLALWPALKELDKSFGAIGVVLSIASWAVTLAYPATGGGAPALVYLSDQYTAAGSDAQRVVRLRHPELLPEHGGHHPVVVLAGVHQHVTRVRQAPPESRD